jgi:rubrerythrin
MFSIIGVVLMVVFLMVVVNIVRSGFQTTRMVNKVFSLAEREIDRKLQETSNAEPRAAQPQLVQCSHCGSQVSAGAQCPNCGANLGPFAADAR